jgi:hypothetical protein
MRKSKLNLLTSRYLKLSGQLDIEMVRPFPLHTVFLTFQMTTLPEYVHVRYERVTVRAYIPNRMRCYRCQKFGHTQSSDKKCPTYLEEKAIQELKIKGLSFPGA